MTNNFDINRGLKLKELYIKKYKALKDFKINFTDNDDNPLSIIVLAGVNGSGKTTLLEYIHNFVNYLSNEKKNMFSFSFDDYINILFDDRAKSLAFSQVDTFSTKHTISRKNVEKYKSEYNQNIVYLPIYESSIDNIKNSILIHYRIISRELDSHKKALKEIQNIIDNIFEGMNINLTVDDVNDVDKNDEKVVFKNRSGDNFNIEDLSTGQKTLLSKILSLYFSNINDKVILIDEPELSLHPSWQNRVLKLYENFALQNNCQIIIATHSPHIIGSAKNEYLRILTDDGVINDVLAYGRDIEWVLEEIMGIGYTREKSILDKFNEIQELINSKKYDEADKELDNLENIIGSHDSLILRLRNDLFFERTDYEEDS